MSISDNMGASHMPAPPLPPDDDPTKRPPNVIYMATLYTEHDPATTGAPFYVNGKPAPLPPQPATPHSK